MLGENLLPTKVNRSFLSWSSWDERRAKLNVCELFTIPLLLIVTDWMHIHRDLEITSLIECKRLHFWLVMEIFGLVLNVAIEFWLLVHPIFVFFNLREIDITKDFVV